MAANAGDMLATLGLENKQFIDAMTQAAQSVDQNTGAISAQFEKIGGALNTAAQVLASFGVGSGLAKFASECLDAATATDKLYGSFTALNGATEETKQVFDSIKDLELSSKFDFAETLGPAAKNMMLLGVGAQQTADTMTALVDAAAGLKQGPQWITQVSDAIANMQSHVVASSRDIKALQQDGIDAYGALARQMGLSMGEAQDEIKKGMLSSQQVIDAVTTDLGERWRGAAADSMNSWAGAMHLLDAATNDAMADIGRTIKSMLDEASPLITAAANAVKEFGEMWQTLPGPLKDVLVIVPAVAAAVVALAGAWKGLTAALELMDFNPVILGITALVAALALIAKWAYENWPAIEAVFKEAVDYLSKIFAPLIAVWEQDWADIKAVLQTVWDWISTAVQKVGSAISAVAGFVGGIAGAVTGTSDEFKKLGAVWDDAQQKMAAAAQADKDRKAAQDAAAASSAQQRIALQQQEAAELAAANAAKERAAQQKAAAEQAKQLAAEEQKILDGLLKGYQALQAVSPDVAKSISDSMGAVSESAARAKQAFGEAYDYLSDAQKKAAEDTLALGDAYKTLGVTSEQALINAAQKADDAFKLISGSATATQKDVENATDAMVAAHKKLADFLNNDAITAVHAFGMKTADELKQSEDNWFNYADKVTQVFGEGTSQALQAQLKAFEQYQSDMLAQGKVLSDAELQHLADLKKAVEAAKDPLLQLNDAYAALGVKTVQSQVDQIKALADALADAEKITGDTVQTNADLYDGQQKLTKAVSDHIDLLNGKWKQAHDDGKATATQMYQAAYDEAVKYLQQVTATSDGSQAALALIAAATDVVGQRMHALNIGAVKETETAFHDMGIHTQAELEAMQQKADDEFARIAASGETNATTMQEAWLKHTKDTYDNILQMGGTLTESQKSEYDKQEQQLKDHLTTTGSMWKTAYDGVKGAVTGAFNDMVTALVTGDQSFGQVMTKMLQSIAETAINTFIQPFRDAVAKFVANELADLLGGKGLGGVSDSLKSIGSTASSIFGGGSSGAGSIGGGIPISDPGITEGATDASGAASGASSAIGGVMGAVGAIGSAVSAISGIIGNFQSAKQETTLNAIEHNTRYTMMYVGEQADGGIFHAVSQMRDLLDHGLIQQDIQRLANQFDDYHDQMLPIAWDTRNAVQKVSDYADLSYAALSDSRDLLASIDASVKSLTINVSPEGITTADAARALGDQIAKNMAAQLTLTAV
jgi:tape measure domain-containing protein